MRRCGWLARMAGVLLMAGARPVLAQATAPAGGPNRLVVSEIRGIAEVRQSEKDRWQAVKVGMDMAEGAEFRTGPHSVVRILFPPDQEVTLDRLGVVKVLRAQLDGKTAHTRLGMKYGRVQYDVEQSGVEHDASILSPGATLAVRGTQQMGLYDQGFYTPQAYARQPVAFRNIRGRLVRFGQRGGALATVSGESAGAAQEALAQSVINPNTQHLGFTPSETAVIFRGFLPFARPQDLQFSVLGRIFSQDFTGSGGGTLPIGKQLRFLMVWTGMVGSDVDLAVVSPAGEVVSKLHPTVPSSGHYLGNGVAVGKGVGAEQIVFERSFIPGKYTIQEQLNTKGAVDVRVFVVRDPLGKGTTVGIFHDKLTPGRPSAQHTLNVGEGSSSPATPSRPRSR